MLVVGVFGLAGVEFVPRTLPSCTCFLPSYKYDTHLAYLQKKNYISLQNSQLQDLFTSLSILPMNRILVQISLV